MTGRTHDLSAFTMLTLFVATQDVPVMRLATIFVALAANILGAITPDLDQPTAQFWRDLPTGSIIGRIVHPLLGGHRIISHSLLGMAAIGYLLKLLLARVGLVLLVDMNIVWGAFMLGYLSHLLVDTITKEGVPWLFPLPVRFGFPPLKALRITTGTWTEKFIIFPLLLVLNGYLIYHHYSKFLSLFGR